MRRNLLADAYERYLNEREESKRIAKILREQFKGRGISIGIVSGNGTTAPNNPKNFDIYFVIESVNQGTADYRRERTYLDYDVKLANEIAKVLTEAQIEYSWDGVIYHSFEFPVKKNVELSNLSN